MQADRYDVLIVGAGPAGSVCARNCARAGLHTLLVEAEEENDYGYPCVIEIETDVFAATEVPPPAGEEVAFSQQGLMLFSPSGKHAYTVEGHPLYDIRLDLLVRRLVAQAQVAGAEARFGVRCLAPLVKEAWVAGIRVRLPNGDERELFGRAVVDATGETAALVRRLPPACGIDFTDRETDRVLAEARLYAIDLNEAEAAARAGQIKPECLYHQIGLQGPYSTLSYLVSLEKGTAWTLVGLKDEFSPPGPEALLAEVERSLPYLRKMLYRARKPIRIRRASLRLVCDGFAAIGEAAGMTIPMHASGVASGMLAGHHLGRHLGRILADRGPATTENLWPWCAEYQRGRGAVLASYDMNRRILETLDAPLQVEAAFEAGMTDEEDMVNALNARPLRISLRTLPRRALGSLLNPAIGLAFMKPMPRIFQVELHWRDFPPVWEEARFAAWKKTAENLLP